MSFNGVKIESVGAKKYALSINWQDWQTIKPIPCKLDYAEEYGCHVSDRIIREWGIGETIESAILELAQSIVERYQVLETCGLEYEDDRQEFETLKSYLRRKVS